jgi:hypothetical protein
VPNDGNTLKSVDWQSAAAMLPHGRHSGSALTTEKANKKRKFANFILASAADLVSFGI